MIFLVFIISVLYLMLIMVFIFGFYKSDVVKNKKITPKNRFSIVIPFRNEAHNLPNLLQSLSEINYPTDFFEILLVNDDSEDNFIEIIKEFIRQNPNLNLRHLQNIRKTESPKKDALNTAIKLSNFEWIVTTDADCLVPKLWLHLFNQFIEEKQPVFISAPVKFSLQNSLLYHFQNLNFISLIGSTIGGFGIENPFMCNGANLCYRKAIFFELNGFEGNVEIASGDDIFLMEKMIKAYPKKVKFLKSDEVIVETKAENSWKLFLHQQIRWASKSASYKIYFVKFVGLCVFSENLMVLILGVFTLLFPQFWIYFILIFVAKAIVDFIIIAQTSFFLKNTKSLKHYLIISFLHPFFIVFTGCLSAFKSYEWKGRSFRK
ncbi:glycosyltransferase [Lutibacter sp.]|uniref:glycosyltransferase family 2 protein n=1 Tax=Lutibacter sp. TaxID=1925666 RepID=UPI003566C32C